MGVHRYDRGKRSWKTETVLAKLREAPPATMYKLAWELASRDLDLARDAVLAYAAAHGAPAEVRIALHYAADAAHARQLLREPGFDPAALHLPAYAALIDDLEAALPTLSADAAEAELRLHGLLATALPIPLDDDADSVAACAALHVRFLSAAVRAPALVRVRGTLAAHLRETRDPVAAAELVRAWQAGEVGALDAVGAVARLGLAAVEAVLGAEGAAGLAEATVREIAGATIAGPLPEMLFARAERAFPAPWPCRIASAIFAAPGLAGMHASAAHALVTEHGEEGSRAVLAAPDRAPAAVLVTAAQWLGAAGARVVLAQHARLTPAAVEQAARILPYAEAAALLGPLAVANLDAALFFHPGAPADRALITEAESALAGDPARALRILERVASRADHPDRAAARARLARLVAEGPVATRRQAIHYFARAGDPAATSEIVAAFDDPALADAHTFLVSALADCGDARALPRLQRMPQSAAVLQAIAQISARAG